MATKLTSIPLLYGADLLSNSSTQLMNLGSYAESADGRGFRYAKAVATTVAGKLYQTTPRDATNMCPSGGLTPSANVAIGGTQITISDSITLTANQLAGGYLSVAVTPGEGYTYRIAGNTAVTGAASCVITLEDPLQVAITTASRIVMCANPYGAAVVMPTSITSAPLGVSTYIITTAYYGWFQTHGACAVLNNGGTAIGLGITPGGAEGAVKSGATTLPDIGYCLTPGITTEYDLVFLTID